MNKTLLPMLCFLLPALILTGQPVRISSESLNKGVKAEYSRPAKDRSDIETGVNRFVGNPLREMSEHQLGTSFYDLQSNYMLQNRICYNPSDGTIGVVWTKGMDAPDFGDRGTGYNFFDGTSWLPEPEARIENAKTGWPNYAFLGENG